MSTTYARRTATAIVAAMSLLFSMVLTGLVTGPAHAADAVTAPESTTKIVFDTGHFGSPVALVDTADHSIPGTILVPGNAHVHANWVFTEPGTYTLTAKATAGSLETNTATYTCVVGGPTPSGTEASDCETPAPVDADRLTVAQRGGLAADKDLGTQIVDGRLVPSLKDDRQSPAVWIDPASVVFELGDAAKSEATIDMSFIAPAGKTVYAIPSTQIAGVPWLGGNTMHPSVLSNVNGGVTWTLRNVQGPGKFAMYLAGRPPCSSRPGCWHHDTASSRSCSRAVTPAARG